MCENKLKQNIQANEITGAGLDAFAQEPPGYESVISKGNSDMKYMGFGRILLKVGESVE